MSRLLVGCIARRRRHLLARCRCLGGCLGGKCGDAGVDDETHLDRVAQNLPERLRDHAREALLDPVAGEVVGYADDESTVVQTERQSAIEPESEGGFVEASAQLRLCGVPDECQLVVRGRLAI